MDDWFDFDEVPWSRLTDQSGRRWKPHEILAMSCEQFTQKFFYYGREGILVYGMVAADGKREEAAKLSPGEHRRFDAVDRRARSWRSEMVRLTKQLDWWRYDGTRGQGQFLFFGAEGENRIRRAVMGWRVDVAGGRTRYRRASAHLRDKASRRVHEPPRIPKASYLPDPQVVRRAWHRLERDLDAMDALAPTLHSYPLSLLADDMNAAAGLLLEPRSRR